MALSASTDFLTMTIPNRLSAAVAIGFFPFALWVGLSLPVIGVHGACAAAVLAGAFVLFALGIVGGGDAKLAAATALWLGWEQLPEYGMRTAVYGGLLTLALILARRQTLPTQLVRFEWAHRLMDPKAGVPYGIALAFAALSVYPQSAIWAAAGG